MSINAMEDTLIKMSTEELIRLCLDRRIILNERMCNICTTPCKFVKYNDNMNKYAWRCINKNCNADKKYTPLGKGTFFKVFNAPLLIILKIIIRYSAKVKRSAMILIFSEVDKALIYKICDRIIDYMPECDFGRNKLGGPGKIVQIDETMLNYKCKSHKNFSPSNKTDALCIVEFDERITWVFSTVIENRKATTLIPIICSQVAANSIIWTDEHRSYTNLSSHGFTHNTVCH